MNFNSFLNGTLIPAAIGGAGAVAVDVAMGYATPFLPAMLQTGPAAILTRIAGAVGVGMVAGMVSRDRRLGEQVMAGAILVTVYGFAKDLVKTNFPTLPLSESDRSGEGMAAYVSGMGYSGPALVSPDRLGVYVGNSGTWNPSIAAALSRGVTSGRTVARPLSGAHDEFSEGGYHYN